MNSVMWLAELEITAALEAGKVPTFSMVAYTGGKLPLKNFPHPVVVDLSGASFHSSIIANVHHDKRRPIGTVIQASNDGRQLVMAGELNHAGQDRQSVIESAGLGFRYQASIEATPHELEMIEDGDVVTVNGQSVEGPAIIARKATVHGVAFVPQGADDRTTVDIAASAAHFGGADMTFEKWCEQLGVKVADLSQENQVEIRAAYDAKYPAKSAKKAGAKDGDLAATPAADTWSAEEIRAAYDESRDALETLELEMADEYPAEAIKAALSTARKSIATAKGTAVREKWSADKFGREADRAIHAARADVLRSSRPTGPAIHSSGADMSGEVIEAALAQTLRLPDLDKSYEDKHLQAAHKLAQGRLGLQQLIIMAAAAHGWRCGPGTRLTDGNLREALGYAFADPRYCREIRATGFASVGLTGILSNVANKEILMGYEEVDASWREIAAIKSVSDFKQVTAYRLLDSLEYEELAPAGRIKHGTVGEESYTRQAKTYAKMLAITRTDIINDDLGAFDDLRTRLGRGGAKKLSSVFWTAFLNDASFFTSGNTNYISGATTNLGTDGVGIGLGVKAFRKMTSPTADGTKRVGIGMSPTKLVVPPELEANAEILYRNTNLGTVANSSANIYANKYRPIVVNQLSDSAFTGYSATAWYLFGDEMAPMVVSFLNGQQSPTVESSDVDFDQLGIQFRGYHDFGCDKAEYLAGIKSKGAA